MYTINDDFGTYVYFVQSTLRISVQLLLLERQSENKVDLSTASRGRITDVNSIHNQILKEMTVVVQKTVSIEQVSSNLGPLKGNGSNCLTITSGQKHEQESILRGKRRE